MLFERRKIRQALASSGRNFEPSMNLCQILGSNAKLEVVKPGWDHTGYRSEIREWIGV